jgi:hypothetical protein
MAEYKRPASLDRINNTKSSEDRLLEQLQQEMLYLCQEHRRRFGKN